MHMNSAPHLRHEDRAEFARLLDEALRAAEYRPDPASAAGNRLNTEQLRTMALSATTAIAACATAEYQHYVKLRDELRAPASPAAGNGNGQGKQGNTSANVDLAAAVSDAAEPAGAGLTAVIMVLAPVLAGVAAILFLLIGYILRGVGPEQTAAEPLINVGWVFGGIAAAGLLVAMAGMVLTALRNGATSTRAGHVRGPAREVELAREAWREALLERGLHPFLREALKQPPMGPVRGASRYVPRRGSEAEGRIPALGYSRPDFTSPDGGPPAAPRPRFTSPDFTSPDYGGPDHQPD
ncbi:hypothetical protein [Streptomyces sp. NPDC003077]|uniref:hypothetical protein n=1 Tax=Streptomyces sp. NPDC003077 TaxID=3154443 RepID=UPI0033B3FB52